MVEILGKVPDKTGFLVKAYSEHQYREYSARVCAWVVGWDALYAGLPCSDIRNTLVTTAYSQKGWNLSLMERFVGHKGNVDSLRREARDRDVSLDHYVSNDLDFLFQRYQAEIIPKIEEHLSRPTGPEQNSTEIAQRDDECTKIQKVS